MSHFYPARRHSLIVVTQAPNARQKNADFSACTGSGSCPHQRQDPQCPGATTPPPTRSGRPSDSVYIFTTAHACRKTACLSFLAWSLFIVKPFCCSVGINAIKIQIKLT